MGVRAGGTADERVAAAVELEIIEISILKTGAQRPFDGLTTPINLNFADPEAGLSSCPRRRPPAASELGPPHLAQVPSAHTPGPQLIAMAAA